MSNPCVILEMSGAEGWNKSRGCRVIPALRQATMLHPSRLIAEAEALRLSAAYPGCRFAVFEAAAVAVAVEVPTHITVGGQVIASHWVPTLAELGEQDLPF